MLSSFEPSVTWDTFTALLGTSLVMEEKWLTATQVSESPSYNKIFIDWIRNKRGTALLYSLRARRVQSVHAPNMG